MRQDEDSERKETRLCWKMDTLQGSELLRGGMWIGLLIHRQFLPLIKFVCLEIAVQISVNPGESLVVG